MFLDYFGFIEQPFGVTPDPRFLYLGPQHREALASLIYGTEMNRGFLALIAPPGMGKTSLLFQYLEGLRNKARTAFLFHGAHDSRDLMRYLLTDLELNASGKELPEMHEMLNRVLTEEMQAGRRFLLVIDEAQNLSDELLESVRLLSNFETPWTKLMQIVLSGQPQLGKSLARPAMRQLRQRISSFIQLEPFTPDGTNSYIDHRLWVAGREGPPLFAPGAKSLIAEHSGGIPRNINNLCFQSLSIAFAMGKKNVDLPIVREAICDLSIETSPPNFGHPSAKPLAQIGRMSTSSPPLAAEQNPHASKSSRRLGKMAAPTFAFAVLLLGFVSGALWKAAAPPSEIGATPSVEAAALPNSAALPRAPEAIPRHAASRDSAAAEREAASLPSNATGAAPNGTTAIVVVSPGVTLRHLCLLYLDRFDPTTLAQIRALNPTMTDPDYIEAGQTLRLPLDARQATSGRSAESEPQLEFREGPP